MWICYLLPSGSKQQGYGYKPTPVGYTPTPHTHFVIVDISSYIVMMTRLNKRFIMRIIAKQGTLLLIAARNSSGAPRARNPQRKLSHTAYLPVYRLESYPATATPANLGTHA